MLPRKLLLQWFLFPYAVLSNLGFSVRPSRFFPDWKRAEVFFENVKFILLRDLEKRRVSPLRNSEHLPYNRSRRPPGRHWHVRREAPRPLGDGNPPRSSRRRKIQRQRFAA